MEKRNSIWPFIGGLLLGAVAVKLVGEYNQSKKQKEVTPEPKIKETNTDVDREIQMVEDLIDELVSKPNKTKRDRDNIDLLRIKLAQLRNV